MTSLGPTEPYEAAPQARYRSKATITPSQRTWHEQHIQRLRRIAARKVQPVLPPVEQKPVELDQGPPADLHVDYWKLSKVVTRPENGQWQDLLAAAFPGTVVKTDCLAPTVRDFIEITARKHGVTASAIKSYARHKFISQVRQEVYYLAAKDTIRSLPEIGKHIGKRDHTSVLHGIKAHCYRNRIPLPRGMKWGNWQAPSLEDGEMVE